MEAMTAKVLVLHYCLHSETTIHPVTDGTAVNGASTAMQPPRRFLVMPDNMISSASSASAMLSIESRASWVAAGVALAILSVTYGSALLSVVGLRVMDATSACRARLWRSPGQ